MIKSSPFISAQSKSSVVLLVIADTICTTSSTFKISSPLTSPSTSQSESSSNKSSQSLFVRQSSHCVI
ncbi:MAG: hypothetical protein ACJZ03_03715 [Candidatus Neomarinimicrobiota bacterium]